jgi:hypothetical protein
VDLSGDRYQNVECGFDIKMWTYELGVCFLHEFKILSFFNFIYYLALPCGSRLLEGRLGQVARAGCLCQRVERGIFEEIERCDDFSA